MIHLKNREEIELMRESALIVSKTLGVLAEKIEPGITPKELDKLAHDFILDNKGVPGFLGLYGFPATLCTSVNEQVVHGIPGDIPLKEGDIISVDCGVKKNGFYGDHAYTFAVGNISDELKQLLRVTKESLYLGIDQMVSGNRIGDLSYAIQTHAEKFGYGVVRELVGHGLGKQMHESPEVPNFGKRGKGT
ncbi:MAG: type I methionyl aminopeptidase, partial [Cyclobacteriaceae bacterium]|nr:type I methionyl aminopeptidase [Cyclobacteriaceae bacterium]